MLRRRFQNCKIMVGILLLEMVLGALVAQSQAQNIPATDLAPLLPPVIYAVQGVPLTVYYDNLILADEETKVIGFTAECELGHKGDRSWVIETKDAKPGVYSFKLSARTSTGKLHQATSRIVLSAPMSQQRSLRMLIVGDSLTDATWYPNRIATLLEENGQTDWSMIGTRKKWNALPNVQHEGYGGRAWPWFVRHHEAEPDIKANKFSSPFVFNQAENKPALDVDRYLEKHADGKKLDVITILLGINDCFTASRDPEKLTAEKLRWMFENAGRLVAEFRKVCPDAKIGICITPPSNSREAAFVANYKDNYPHQGWQLVLRELQQAQIKRFRDRERENIYLIPIELHVDATAGFPDDNAVHPNKLGYNQIGDAIYSWMAAMTASLPEPALEKRNDLKPTAAHPNDSGSADAPQETERLPGSKPLRPDADKLKVQRKQVFDYFDRQIAATQEHRDKRWQSDDLSLEAYQRFVESHRPKLRTMLGLVEGDARSGTAIVEHVTKNDVFQVERIFIPVTDGLTARGLLFTPHSVGKKPAIVICPDADTWPERLAQTSPLLDGHSTVLIMQSVERLVDHSYCEKTRGKDRRWILYRLGFVVGRTMPGLDVQDTLAAVEFLSHQENVDAGNISITGRGQGGMTALLTAALDTRISAVTVTDYFDCRNRCWAEPVDRRLRDQLLLFGDAELAAMIAPRPLTIQASPKFLADATAFDAEVKRATRFYQDTSSLRQLTIAKDIDTSLDAKHEFEFSEKEASAARDAHFEERLSWLRKQIDQSETKRYARWKILEQPAVEFPSIIEAMLNDYRQMTGSLPDDGTPPIVRSELALATESYRVFRVSIDVRKGVDVYGHLILPAGFEGKRPAVICQHGFGGMPEKISGVGMTSDSSYHEVGRKLAQKGYVVFAPTLMHIQPSEEVSRQTRQATAIGKMRLAMPLAKTNRVIDFLESLPSVDEDRIGYYGLSYGGYSAIWMAPLLDRLAVNIISGNFNDWRTKITSGELNTSYLRHTDEDMYSWDCLNRFTHPELIAMMSPRPVCIEYGNRDGITTPEWTAYAWKQTTAIRDYLGLTDRIHLYEFDGPHEINGVETFEFLDRWLKPE